MNVTLMCEAAAAQSKAEVGSDKCPARPPEHGSGGLPFKTAGKDWQEKCYG